MIIIYNVTLFNILHLLFINVFNYYNSNAVWVVEFNFAFCTKKKILFSKKKICAAFFKLFLRKKNHNDVKLFKWDLMWVKQIIYSTYVKMLKFSSDGKYTLEITENIYYISGYLFYIFVIGKSEKTGCCLTAAVMLV